METTGDARDYVAPSFALESKIDGFKACFGGEELKRASATLAGAVVGGTIKFYLASDVTPSTFQQDLDSASSGHHGALDEDPSTRELLYASKLFSAQEQQHQDYDTLYSHGLVLQELASKVHQQSTTEHISYLHQACAKYEAAVWQRPCSHAALYNWGVALSDLARVLKESSPQRARDCLSLASQKYAQALHWQPGNPQALNNWGLVLQEMSADSKDRAERDRLVHYALEKFRHAIRLRPGFDRGCYNLGTVCYTYACTLQAEAAAQHKSTPSMALDGDALRQRQAREADIRSLFATAAQYICLAYALQQHKDIYRKSLSVVKAMLPLPFLRAGHLTAPVPATHGTPFEVWRRDWFVLDHVSLRGASNMESSLSTAHAGLLVTPQLKPGASDQAPLVIALLDITRVERCDDPSLPEGHALWISLSNYPEGVYLVAEDAAAADAWVDALLLCRDIVEHQSPDALAEALLPAHPKRTARSSHIEA